jgi:hypothetical protein
LGSEKAKPTNSESKEMEKKSDTPDKMVMVKKHKKKQKTLSEM